MIVLMVLQLCIACDCRWMVVLSVALCFYWMYFTLVCFVGWFEALSFGFDLVLCFWDVGWLAFACCVLLCYCGCCACSSVFRCFVWFLCYYFASSFILICLFCCLSYLLV